jgi:hypothetical protein
MMQRTPSYFCPPSSSNNNNKNKRATREEQDAFENEMKNIRVKHAPKVAAASFKVKEGLEEIEKLNADMAAEATAAGYDSKCDHDSHLFFNNNNSSEEELPSLCDFAKLANAIHLKVADFIAATTTTTADTTTPTTPTTTATTTSADDAATTMAETACVEADAACVEAETAETAGAAAETACVATA